MKEGFRYYIDLGDWYGLEGNHEKFFEHLEDCVNDAHKQGYNRDMIGIDYCKEDNDGQVEVVLNITKPKGYLHEEGFTYYNEEEANKMREKTSYLIPINEIRKSIKNANDHSIFIIEVTEEDCSIEIFLEDILVKNSRKKILEITSGRGGLNVHHLTE